MGQCGAGYRLRGPVRVACLTAYLVELVETETGLLQQLQRIQVVAFDEQVLRGIEVHALVPAGAQGFGNRRIGRQQRLALARPIELVALLRPLDDAGCQFLPQQIEVDGLLQFALGVACFGDTVGEQLGQPGDIGGGEVGGMHFEFL